MLYLISTGIGVLALAAYAYANAPALSPDGRIYGAFHVERPPRPFIYRWLLPLVLRDNLTAWRVTTGGALIASAPLLAWYLVECAVSHQAALWGVLLWVGLPGIYRISTRFPVLVDAPAICLALLAACLVLSGHLWLGVAVSCLSGCVSERAPVFASVFAWQPLLLIGLTPFLLVHLLVKPGRNPDWRNKQLANPIKAGLFGRRGAPVDMQTVFLPWGAVAPLALLSGSWHPAAVVGVVLAYAQVLVATDLVRLYSWAAPLLIVLAVGVLPAGWAPLILAAHLLNPWGRNDV